MKDRATIIDLTLAFAATFVITLAFWPRSAPLQVVRLNTPEGGWKTYSIALTDPNLVSLRRQLERWKSLDSDPNYAAAKWQKELADFYRNEEPETESESDNGQPEREPPTTARISDTVATASYETPLDGHENLVELTNLTADEDQQVPASPSDKDYWRQVSQQAEATMRAAEAAKSQAPIVFTETIPPSLPTFAFHFAFLMGIVAACGYMHWLAICPAKTGVPFREQTPGVAARVGTFIGVISFAMISSITMLM